MAIYHSYAAFRQGFAQVARSEGVSLTYVSGTHPQIIRSSGSFVADGFQSEMKLTIFGTASNDGTGYTIASASSSTITLIVDDALVDEGPVTSSLLAAYYERDGAEQWRRDRVRYMGFDGGATIVAPPINKWPFDVTINGGLTDAADGDSYDWFVSMRHENPDRQFARVKHHDPAKSGTIRFSIAPAGINGLDYTVPHIGDFTLNGSQRNRAFKLFHAYVRRKSDGALQIIDIGRLVNAESAAA